MLKRNSLFIVILCVTIVIVGLSINSAIADPAIPQWIRSSAKYWAAGNTTDAEYIQGIQYLIQQGVINLPVKEVTATNTGLSEASMASSFIVHFKTPSINFDIYTISKITQPTNININGKPSTSSSEIQFESIPSKDKKKYYDLLAYYINTSGDGRDTVDINIDILANDSSIIETLQYSKCQAVSYYVLHNDNKMQYRFSQADVMELRDQAIFSCDGEHIVVPTYK